MADAAWVCSQQNSVVRARPLTHQRLAAAVRATFPSLALFTLFALMSPKEVFAADDGTVKVADAAAPASKPADAAPPADDTTALSAVVVTATRKEERLNAVPISTSVLGGEQLQALGMSGQDIRQLAASVPSLQVESSNGRTFPRFYIRGYGNTDFTAFASQPVSLVYDDIVQENPALKGFPIFDQKDVEVLRGPQGTLFGRNSPAGVVKLESARPQLGQSNASISISDGTYNTAVFQGIVNIPVSDTTAMRFSMQEQHRDNWVNDPVTNSSLLGYDDIAVRAQFLYIPSDSFSALFNVHGRTLDGPGIIFRANIIQPGSEGSLVPGFSPSTWFGDGKVAQTYSSLGANAHLTWELPDFTLMSITGYESIRHYFTQGDIDGGFGAGNVFCQPACTGATGPGYIPFGVETAAGINSHEQLTEEVRMVSNATGPLTWQGGVFLFYEDTKAFSNDYDITGQQLLDTTISQQKNDAEAVYGSATYATTPDLKLTAGVRFTHDNKSFAVPFTNLASGLASPTSASANADKVSWDLSANYRFAPDDYLYAKVATGFRAPSFGAPSAPANGSPGLGVQIANSEDVISYETGVKADLFERRARVAFDIYYFEVQHQQLTAVGGVANQTQLLNAAKTVGHGAELEFEDRLTPELLLNLSASYNFTEIKDPNLAVGPCFNWSFAVPGLKCTELNPLNAAGNALVNGNPLPQAPKVIADISLRYGRPVRGADEAYVFTDWSYRSKANLFIDAEREFTEPAIWLGGLRLGYTWENKKYDAALFCRNCTNTVRLNGGINFENFTGFVNDPRIIGAQFSMKL